jgi:23S rRNA (uracil1939-C5)-methyltransferase
MNSPKRRPPQKSNRPPQKPNRPAQKPIANDTPLSLDIIGMVYGGYGVAQHGKQAVYVPYTIEGEKITARLTQKDGDTQFAQGVNFLKVSRDRTQPECTHFGRCWGCQWQHIEYPAQLLIKFDVVAEQLQKHGKLSDEVLGRAIQPVLACEQQWGYNSQATFRKMNDNRFGFARRDKGYEAIEHCNTLHPELQALYESLDIEFGDMRSYSLLRGSDGATMMILHMETEDLPEMEADLSTSVNVLLPDREPLNLFGDSLLNYQVKDRWLRATAGSFFRANVPQVNAIVDEVLFGLKLTGKEQVLDLYAGVGTFSAFIAPHAEIVTLVESYPPAATDADENLASVENVDVVEGIVGEVLDDMLDTNARYDAIVLDPPTRGVDAEDMARIIKLNSPRIVYVSSQPSNLGRDAQTLLKAGYRLERVQPIDVAPQTYYADTVATFVKG